MNHSINGYQFTVRALSIEEGGGYLAESLDLKGCISDGEIVEEAIHNLEIATISWIRIAKELGHPIPEPTPHSQVDRK